MTRSNALVGGVFTLALAGLAACVGDGHVRVTGHAHVETPRLVYLGPGIWVVEDYHQPVFYSDGYYWRYYDGLWYRSTIYHGDWVRVRTRVVPRAVVRIDRPRRFKHYHAREGARVRRGPPPKRRDHRSERVPARRGNRDVHVRDHRGKGKAKGKGHRKHR